MSHFQNTLISQHLHNPAHIDTLCLCVCAFVSGGAYTTHSSSLPHGQNICLDFSSVMDPLSAEDAGWDISYWLVINEL